MYSCYFDIDPRRSGWVTGDDDANQEKKRYIAARIPGRCVRRVETPGRGDGSRLWRSCGGTDDRKSGTAVLSTSHVRQQVWTSMASDEKNGEKYARKPGQVAVRSARKPRRFFSTKKRAHVLKRAGHTTIWPSSTVGRYEIVMFARGPYITRSGQRDVFAVVMKTSLTGPYKISGKYTYNVYTSYTH